MPGKTKFTLKKMVRFAFDGLLSFSDKPLKITSLVGFLITTASFLMGLRIMINKIRFPETLVSGWTSLILTVLFMGGIQLISLGHPGAVSRAAISRGQEAAALCRRRDGRLRKGTAARG